MPAFSRMSASELVRIRGSAFTQPRYGIIQVLIVDDAAEVGAPLLQAELEEPVLVGFETLDLESSVRIESRGRDPPEQGEVLDRGMLGQDRVDAVAIGPAGDGIEVGARALEVRDHPALGGFALLFGEFLGVDDHAILTGEGEKIFHPLPANRDVAHGRKRDERLEERSAVDLLPSAATISGNPSSTNSTSLGSIPPSSSALPSWAVLETPFPMTANLRPLKSLKSLTASVRSLRMTMAAKPNPLAT